MTISLSNLIPTPAVDVVGVFDVVFNQVFPEGVPIKAAIKMDSTFFTHPLESGATRTDHVIILPIEITLNVLLSGETYRDTYKQIKQIFLTQTELVVQTRTDSYEKMYIQSMPHDEDPDMYDAVIVSISLRESQEFSSEIVAIPESDSDTGTVGRGQQDAKAPTPAQQEKSSALFKAFY